MSEKERGRPTGPGAAPISTNHDQPNSDLGSQSSRDPFVNPAPATSSNVVPIPSRGQTVTTSARKPPAPVANAALTEIHLKDLARRLEEDATATPENFRAVVARLNDMITLVNALRKRVQESKGLTHEDRVKAELERLRARDEAGRVFQEETGAGSDPLTAFMVDATALDELPDPTPLIPGVLNRESYALLTGRDGSMKTFVALDWALSLATGEDWNGKRVYPLRDRPKVLFMVGEGRSGFKKRVRAWQNHRKVQVPQDRFTALFQRINFFRDQSRVDELVQFVHEEGYGLVVIDHLRLISGGADGNGSDMGLVVDNIKRLVDATAGGSVLLIAHTDKGDNDTRGFSGIEDDSDTVWHAKRPTADQRKKPGAADEVTLKNSKMKDESEHADVILLPRAVKVGTHPTTGDPITSLILEAPDPFEREAEAPANRQEAVLTLFRDVFGTTGATVSELVRASRDMELALSEPTIRRALADLTTAGQLVQPKVRGPWFLAPEEEADDDDE